MRFRVDTADSSVSASILGLARKKAIYRKGLGATLLNGLTEAELRRQPVSLPAPPGFSSDTVDRPLGDRVADTPLPGLGRARLDSAVAEAFNDPAAAWQQDPRKAISWQQLMQMTSGLRFHWFPAGPSDLTNMLFKEKDMAAFAAGLPLQAPPGTRFLYSDGNANILSRLIRDQLGDSAYYRFPYEEIFYKTGMLHTTLEPDAAGNFVGCSYCYATARDWARFGLLYLNDGVANGQRILPEGWVRWTTSPSGVHNNEDGNGEYGALWWVNAGREGHPDWRRFHRLPEEVYSCQGFDGQYVIVIPSKNLIVVRLSLEKGYLDPGDWAADVAAAFTS